MRNNTCLQYDDSACGKYSSWLTILVALWPALGALAAALKVLLWDGSLPCMTHQGLTVVVVHLAPAAVRGVAMAMATAMAVSGGDHCCQ